MNYKEESIRLKKIFLDYNSELCRFNVKNHVLFNYWVEHADYLFKLYYQGNKSELAFQLGESQLGIFKFIDSRFPLKKKETLKFKYNFKDSISVSFGILYLRLFDKIYISGSEGLTNKLMYVLSQCALKYLDSNIKTDFTIFENFKTILRKNFPKSKFIEFVIEVLPEYFFSSCSFKKKSITFIGSPTFFLDHDYSHLISLGDLMRIIGIQHGCNYGIFNLNYYEKFEREISDRFYLWLVSPNKVLISRYNKRPTIKLDKSKSLYWIGRPNITEYVKSQIPTLKLLTELNNFNNIKTIYDVVKKFDFKLIPHLHSDSTYFYEDVDCKYFLRPKYRLEDFLDRESNVLCFDVINSTLIYYAISTNTPFVVYTSDLSDELKGEYYFEFISILKSIKALYFLDDKIEFQDEINKLMVCKNYYNERVNLIKSVRDRIYRSCTKL